jgi:hypothetical protein
VLHLPPRFLLLRLRVSSSSRHQLGIHHVPSLFSMLVTFRAAQAPHGRRKWVGNGLPAWASGRPIRLDVRVLESPF